MWLWNDFTRNDPHSGVCQSILAKSESADVETFAFFIMNEDVEKRHRQWSHISTSPVTLNTPLDKCLPLSFHVCALHTLTSTESGWFSRSFFFFFRNMWDEEPLPRKSLFSTNRVERERAPSPNQVSKIGFTSAVPGMPSCAEAVG